MFKCSICGKELPTSNGLKTHERYCKKLPQWLRDVDDDGKVRSKYSNKKVNARAEGLICELSLEEFCLLIKEANIKSSQLGFTGENYVLARYEDKGNYTYSNCRFIKQSENAKEKKVSDNVKRASSQNIRAFNERIKADSEFRKQIIAKRKLTPYRIKKAKLKKERELILEQNKNKNNSQYGTFWITNGSTNMKWKLEKGPIPEGFYKGRICK